MFPSKLMVMQLSPPMNGSSRFLEDGFQLQEDVLSQIADLRKESLEKSPTPLLNAISVSLWSSPDCQEDILETCFKLYTNLSIEPNRQAFSKCVKCNSYQELRMDEELLLILVSLAFERKIVIYQSVDGQLENQTINFGFNKKIYFAKVFNGYYVLKTKETQTQDEVNQLIADPLEMDQNDQIDISIRNDLGSMLNSEVKLNRSSLQRREELIDEVNQDGELIFQECNKIINEDSTHNSSQKSDQLDDDPQTPPRALNINLNNSFLQADYLYYSNMAHNEVLNSISPNKKKDQRNDTLFTGRLKFYDESKGYGFLIMDYDGSDIFVHSDDLFKAGVTKDYMKSAKQGNIIRFQFYCLNYFGKYNKSRKAVDLLLMQSPQKNIQPFQWPNMFCLPYQVSDMCFQHPIYNLSYSQ